MQGPPIYLASDIHLGAVPKEVERAFLGWLEHCGAEASQVVINGDLFDFWYEYQSVIPRGHTRVLGALAALVDSGTPVTLMGGNHDWWGGDFLSGEIGVRFLQEPTILDLGGVRTLLAHGDGLGSGDLGYRVMKSVLRGSLTRWGFRWLHPDVGAWIARRVSKTGIRPGRPEREQKARVSFLEEWAVGRLAEDSTLALVVLGHTHSPALKAVEPGRFYMNLGDWISRKTYGVLTPGALPVLMDWETGEPLSDSTHGNG